MAKQKLKQQRFFILNNRHYFCSLTAHKQLRFYRTTRQNGHKCCVKTSQVLYDLQISEENKEDFLQTLKEQFINNTITVGVRFTSTYDLQDTFRKMKQNT